MRISRTAVWIACGGVLALTAWWWSSRSAVAYATAALERGDVEVTVSAIGTLRPRRYVDVGVQVSGQITHLHVQPGDVVERGQLLVEIDPSVQRATVDAGRAALAGLRAQLAEQQALRLLAARRLARQRQLTADGATRDEDLRTAEAELATTTARVDYLNAQLAQTEATLKADETRLGFTRIFAPIAGTVVTLHAREGQTLNATYQTPDVLRIADLSTMTVWTEVSEADVRLVKVGQPVGFVTLGASAQEPPRRWNSRVRQVLPAPTEAEKKSEGGHADKPAPGKTAVTYTVLFDVDNSDGELMPQMTAQVSFVIAEQRGVLVAPLSVLTLVPGDQARAHARVLRADGTPESRAVRLGLRNRHLAQVLDGLAEGEALIVEETRVQGQRRWIQW